MAYIPAPFNTNSRYLHQVKSELNLANNNFTILGQAFLNNDPTQPILRATYIGSTAPTNPTAGTTWLDTSSTPTLKVYDGSNWQVASSGGGSTSSNADTVDGFHASQTPTPNTIIPLNSDGVLDLSSTYIKSNVYTFRRVDLTNATSDYMLQVGEEAIIYFTNATNVPLHIQTDLGLYWLYTQSGCGLLPNNTSYSSKFYSTNWGMSYNGSATSTNSSGINTNYFYLGNPSGTGTIISYIDTSGAKVITQHASSFSDNPYSVRHYASHWSSPVSWTSLGTITFLQSSSGYILVRRLA